MTLKELQGEMIAAMKAKQKDRKDAVSGLIAAVKKAAIDEGCREDIPEELVDRIILKELKTAKEQVDTCPRDREELLARYREKADIIAQFAPKQLSEDEIRAVLEEKFAEVIASGNKGLIMKSVMAELRGKADGKLISKVVAELCG
ncbi:MAG TPA: GatB/YqeY domain-containing protein [Candidatus Monoglobus merdigallinarum]|uniref:GatB/YqeY domain-containing protein n=1 Tax=Candidatus Monoglobus merdigallinarum TaxID=2838698 RepID=A0A9D1PRW3_9FIRM|nr:GatB/YqeY domain-containing protein [Candidatus Monoglobus merdigallinarum]